MTKRVFLKNRRAFLRAASVSAGYLTVVGCSGGGAESLTGTAGAKDLGGLLSGSNSSLPPAPSPVDGSSPSSPSPGSSSPSGPVPVTGQTTLRVISSLGGSALPFTAGYAFRQGDIPSGSSVGASGTGLIGFQASVKNRWRDGSVKFAIVSGRIDLAANAERTLTLGRASSSGSGAALSLSDLKGTGITASISFSGYGSATWAEGDWDAPLLSWVSGPEMSSWVYRKPIGTDRHLNGWLEVRLYAGGAVEVVPWVENGYLLVASPGERSGTAAFALGGTQRFSGSVQLAHHTRTYLGSGSGLSHWLGVNPAITSKHDTGYLMSTKVVPAYRGASSGNVELMTGRLAQSYTPLGQHNYPNSMGAAGFDGSIGPLTEWDVAYLTSDADVRAWRAIIVNGYASGRYGIHYRDENTQRMPRFSSFPYLCLNSTNSGTYSIGESERGEVTPAPGGVAPATYTNSHAPAFGFMPYLVTGLWYFMDEMQHAAFFPYLKNGSAQRQQSRYVLESAAGANQIRGAAWALRTIAQAAAFTPDDDATVKAELVNTLHSNIDLYHSRYVAQPNNPLGLCKNDDERYWMDDFFTFAWGYLKDLQAHSASYDARLDAFLAYKYKAIVGRLGANSAGNWSYRRAAQYDGVSSPAGMWNADWNGGTGPWYSGWGEAYLADGWAYESGDTLLGAYADESGFAQSYWGNIQPAIAYAVDHGAAGALEAYNRMVGASNWARNAAYFSTSTPVWSVRPRSVS